MAEEKKDKKKPPVAVASTGSKYMEEMVALLFGLLLLSLLITRLTDRSRDGDFTGISSYLDGFLNFFTNSLWPFGQLLAIIVSALAIWFIFYSLHKTRTVVMREKEVYAPTSHLSGSEFAEEKSGRWKKVTDYMDSSNSSDWRSAIIEADIMLEEVLEKNGYVGESVGEMLKTAQKGDFLSLNDAWEAHKSRNRIAHSGTEFELNEREARRIIAMFESVFREFEAI